MEVTAGSFGSRMERSHDNHPAIRDTADTPSYERIAIEDIGQVELDRSCSHQCREVRELIQSVSTCATGRNLLNDLKALSTQGAQIAIHLSETSDFEDRAVAAQEARVAQAHGRTLWRLEYDAPWWRIGTTNPKDVEGVIEDLVRIRNLAAERMWPGVPPLAPDHVASAFMAELAVRAAPAVGEWRFSSFAPLAEGYDGLINRGCDFDSLDGIMPVLGVGNIRADLMDVLQTIKDTPIGERLFKDLQVYGRSGAVMSIEAMASENRTYCFTAGGGTWFARESLLAQKTQSLDLPRREAYISGFFSNLLRARRMLATALGMLKDGIDEGAVQKQFEEQLIERRRSRTGRAAQRDPLSSNGHASAQPEPLRTAPPLPPKKPKAARDRNAGAPPDRDVGAPLSRSPGASSPRSAGAPPTRSAGTPSTRSAGVPSSRSAAAPSIRSASVPPAENGKSVSNNAQRRPLPPVPAEVPAARAPLPPNARAADTEQQPAASGHILRNMWNSARRALGNRRGSTSPVSIPASTPAVANKYSRLPGGSADS